VSSLSIVIPVREPAEAFEDTLASVLQNRPANCEVLVVHSGPYDDPYDLAGEVSFVIAPPRNGIIEQINLGVSAARAEVVHVIQPGLVVDEGWTEPALRKFANRRVGAVAPMIIHQQTGQIVSAGVSCGLSGTRRAIHAGCTAAVTRKRRRRCEGPDLLAGFWRRSAWEQGGGLDVRAGTTYADIDLALKLRTLGYDCEMVEECQLTHQHQLGERISCWSEGRAAEHLFWRHCANAGWRGSTMLHGAVLFGEFVASLHRPRKLASWFGRSFVVMDLARSRNLQRTQTSMTTHESAPQGEPLRRRDSSGIFGDRDRLTAQRKAVQPS
jgi:GT2 family glycosyltransferase